MSVDRWLASETKLTQPLPLKIQLEEYQGRATDVEVLLAGCWED